LLGPWIRKWAASIVHETLLRHACLHRILETIGHAGLLILHALLLLRHHTYVLLWILREVLWLGHQPYILLGILRSIEACVLLLYSHVVQALTWWCNARLESSRSLHSRRLRLQRR
jgi:hypothetical protein